LLLGCMAAYGLARFRFKGRTTVAYTTLLLRTVPLAVLAIPVFMIWNQWQLVNSLWGLVLLYVAVNLPFTIWLLYGFVLQVPVELEEAAAIDGCGPIRIFTKVLLPLMAPGLAAASIFTFRIAWNEFILALVLTDRGTRTLPVAASLYITDMGVDWGHGHGQPDRNSAADFHLCGRSSNHYRPNCGSRQRLRFKYFFSIVSI
jgi:multiple sugar transport system permease protein